MASGREVYSQLQDTIEETGSRYTKVGKQIKKVQTVVRTLSDEQEKIYSDLALLYLPEMEANAVKNTIKEVRGAVQRIFDQQNARRTQLEEMIEDSNTQRKKYQDKITEIAPKYDELTAKKTEVQGKINQELYQNASYVELIKNAKFTEERLKQDARRADAFEEEASKKLVAYESNNLFMYLVNRNFGTSEQKGNNLIKKLDSFVAKVVNFNDNKKNYDFLKAMPEKIQEEIAREQEKANNLKEQGQKLEKEVSEKYNIKAIVAESNLVEKTRNDLRAAIENADNTASKYKTEIAKLDDKKGEYHSEAIKKLKDYLASESLSNLKEIARKTPTKEDDALVDRLEEITNQLETEKDRVNELKKSQDEIQEKSEKLRDLEREFTENKYDSRRSVFRDDFDAGSLLTGFLLGKVTSDMLSSQIHDNQDFERYSSRHDDDDNSGSNFGGSTFTVNNDNDNDNNSGGFFGGNNDTYTNSNDSDNGGSFGGSDCGSGGGGDSSDGGSF